MQPPSLTWRVPAIDLWPPARGPFAGLPLTSRGPGSGPYRGLGVVLFALIGGEARCTCARLARLTEHAEQAGIPARRVLARRIRQDATDGALRRRRRPRTDCGISAA